MGMTGVSRLFVDSNVLVHATNDQSRLHAIATAALQQAREQGIALVICPQVLREYLVVITRGYPDPLHAPFDAIVGNAESFRKAFHLIEENQRTVCLLGNLVRQYSVYGKQIHDANIVAVMQSHDIRHLLTDNIADFTRFSRIITTISLQAAVAP